MCGIIGYIAKNATTYVEVREKFIRNALIMGTIRGEYSTGVIAGDTNFKVKISRTLSAGNKFVDSKQFAKMHSNGLGAHNNWCMIGHNRAATIGEVSLGNAHPFVFGNITLVHNGTLNHNGASLPSYDKSLGVDSMQIALALSEVEPDNAKAMLNEINGAFCIVWTDMRDKSVNMARNGHRPMHFTWNPDGSFMMFMSDGHMLYTINKSMWKTGAQGDNIYSLDTYKHLKWTHGSLVPEVTAFNPFTVAWKGTKKDHTSSTETSTGNTQTANTKEPSGHTKSAVESAKERWEIRRKKRQGNVGPLTGKASRPMLLALAKYFELTPNEVKTLPHMRFEPENSFRLMHNTVMMQGQIYLTHWGNTPWDAVIYNVPKQQATAHKDHDWTVIPIGITRPMSGNGDFAAILCKLIHCDWAGYRNQLHSNKDFEMIGPDGKLIAISDILHMLKDGCYTCQDELSLGQIDTYKYNDTRTAILCAVCRQFG